MVGQFSVGPVGPVQPLPGGAVDDPLPQGGGEVVRQFGLGPRGLTWLQPLQAALQVGIEPAPDAAGAAAEVHGDVPMRPAALGQQDDLGTVTQAAILGSPKGTFQAVPFVNRQRNANQGPVPG